MPTGDITIVEYFDYQCPYCRKLEPELRQVVQDDGKVRLVLKDWPILGPCLVTASRMALASKYQDKFIQAHDALIGVNSKLTEPRIRELLAAAGIDVDRLNRDLASNAKAIDAILARNNDQATAFGFRGTPSFIVGKFRVPGVLTMAQFGQAIADARKARHKQVSINARRGAQRRARLFRRQLDPVVMGAGLQRVPVGGRDVPVDDGPAARRTLAAGDGRGRLRIIDIDARDQQQRPQDHSQENAHRIPPVMADNVVRPGWFHAQEMISRDQALKQ